MTHPYDDPQHGPHDGSVKLQPVQLMRAMYDCAPNPKTPARVIVHKFFATEEGRVFQRTLVID